MKKIMLGAAAALALSAPGIASAQTSGYVGLGYTGVDDSWDSNKDSVVAIEGAVVTNITGAWNLQFDANISNMEHGAHYDSFSAANVHGFYRNDTFAVGGLVGFGGEGGSSVYNLGVEGQFYLPRLTLTGSYVYGNEFDNGDTDIHAIDVGGEFFITPNTAIGANIGWADSEWSGQDGYTYSISAEHQFAGSPFSLGARLSRADYDSTWGGGHDVDSIGIFGRWNFGTPDLQTRSTQGASFSNSATRNAIGQW